MKLLTMVGSIVLVLLAILIAWAIGAYNKLVALRNRFKNAFSQIDVQLKRRHDLIPNLVETSKAYMAHERGTLEAVIAARTAAISAGASAVQQPGDRSAMQNLGQAESSLTASLGRLFALAEAYPDLKANQTMASLMEALTSTENKIAFARQAYNDAVMSYNTAREVFPQSLIAQSFNFNAAELFVIDRPEEKQTPNISF